MFGKKQRHHVNFNERLCLDDYVSESSRDGGDPVEEGALHHSSNSHNDDREEKQTKKGKKEKKGKRKKNKKNQQHQSDGLLRGMENVNRDVGKHLYELYGVIVHHGRSVGSGHYTSFIKNSNDMWYEMDDDKVRSVGKYSKRRCEQCSCNYR